MAHGRRIGYDGLELACWGDHSRSKGPRDDCYIQSRWDISTSTALELGHQRPSPPGVSMIHRRRHRSCCPPASGVTASPRACVSAPRRDQERRRAAAKSASGGPGFTLPHLEGPLLLPTHVRPGSRRAHGFRRRWNPIWTCATWSGVKSREVHPTCRLLDRQARLPWPRWAIVRRSASTLPEALVWQQVNPARFIQEFPDRISTAHKTRRSRGRLHGHPGLAPELGQPKCWDFVRGPCE